MNDASAGPMAGKTVLVTGGSSGIGQATAEGLCVLGARVGIVGRDQACTQAAAREIAAQAGDSQADFFVADMSVQSQVRRLAAQVLGTYRRLDVLVNNVWGLWGTRRVTVDGVEYTYAVNHLAPFLLTDLPLERLKTSAPARVVTVSSAAQAMGKPVRLLDHPCARRADGIAESRQAAAVTSEGHTSTSSATGRFRLVVSNSRRTCCATSACTTRRATSIAPCAWKWVLSCTPVG